MLNWVTHNFIAIAAAINETPRSDETPTAYCKRVSLEKSLQIARHAESEGAWILSGDTIVFLDGQIIGKPENSAHATQLLQLLSGKEHRVATAITLCRRLNSKYQIWQAVAETRVLMNKLSERMIQEYVKSGDAMGKAGAYAIQNSEFNLAASIDGCYACVMGMPLCHCGLLFEHAGSPFLEDPAYACRAHISYNCTIDTRSMLKQTSVEFSKS